MLRTEGSSVVEEGRLTVSAKMAKHRDGAYRQIDRQLVSLGRDRRR